MKNFYTLAVTTAMMAMLSQQAYSQETVTLRNVGNKYAVLFEVPDSESTAITFRKYLTFDDAWEFTAAAVAVSGRGDSAVGDTANILLSANKLTYFQQERVSAYYLAGGGIQFELGDNRESDDGTLFLQAGIGVEYFISPDFSLGGEVRGGLSIDKDEIQAQSVSSQLKLGYHF